MPKARPKPRATKLKDALSKLLTEQQKYKKKQAAVAAASQPPKPNFSTAAAPKHFKRPYTGLDRILLVGEGNFSFARALVEHVPGTGEGLVATCFDSEGVLIQKYESEPSANIAVIEAVGGTVLYEVDATKLEKCKAIKGKRFDKIVFNFPHAGAGIKDQDRNILTNQSLLLSFLTSSLPFLSSPTHHPLTDKQHGEIHITLKSGTPYDLWNVRQLAKQTGVLAAKTAFPFEPAAYPGYEHRRTLGFKEGMSRGGNEEIEDKKSKTYVFVSKEAVREEVEKVREGMKRKRKDARAERSGARAGRKGKRRGEKDGERNDDSE
ncbi:hypothetical protein BC938DRAFT_475920 [Jimgerdemannia flammicorona]|uniref:25S rRNA (uridine-N(3))-methyltransferase BMT5-like domain-containing protein n=1 Tax=Jimgerdemannia flammicorona TaxID=994334 RepID=A0A433PMH3_9FUNG|nr:hypothetical protein BC938DRAFT_475920 [Jimgerdemannia flammicorona]